MNLAITPEQQRQWMAQWRSAAIELEKVKREDLQALTDERAFSISNMLQSMIAFPRPPRTSDEPSGLVEQQRIFMRARR